MEECFCVAIVSNLCFTVQVYSGSHGRTIVFTQTKLDADELAVSSCLSQDARVLHGDIVQKQREVTLKVSVPLSNLVQCYFVTLCVIPCAILNCSGVICLGTVVQLV